MSIGASVNDLAVLFVASFVAIVLFVLLIGIGRVVGAIIGMKSGLFPVLFMLVAFVGIFYGGSLYMDAAGMPASGRVLKKSETVRIRQEGDWRQDFSATVRYRLDGAEPGNEETPYDPGEINAALKLDAAQFDTLREQQLTPIRIVPLWQTISVVRLASISTRDLIPLPWLFGGAAVVAFGALAWALRNHTLGCGFVVVVGALAVVAIPAAIIYQQWLAMENLAAKPLRATATVTSVERITRIDPLPCRSGRCRRRIDTDFDVPQQYDIVQFMFTPQGREDSVLGVDAADAGTFTGSKGSSVEVAYAPNTPRSAQLIGATHNHHWRNMLAFLGLQIGTLAAIGVFLLVVVLVGNRVRRKRSRAGQRGGTGKHP